MYEGTVFHSIPPLNARAIDRAGLKWAPVNAPKIQAGIITASPQANVIWTGPAPFCPLLFNRTFATTPSPNKISNIVPKNSPSIMSLIITSCFITKYKKSNKNNGINLLQSLFLYSAVKMFTPIL